MKWRLIAVIAILVLSMLTSIGFAWSVSAQQSASLSEKQRELIRDNCVSIKSTLNQLKVSDALLRVNRGQIYESMGSKLMSTFNTRLSNNRLDNRGLVAVATGYDGALAKFRTDYQAYEQQLVTAINIDCTQDPDGFHFANENARTKRAQVHDDVLRLHEYIEDYRSAVKDFQLSYERVSGN